VVIHFIHFLHFLDFIEFLEFIDFVDFIDFIDFIDLIDFIDFIDLIDFIGFKHAFRMRDMSVIKKLILLPYLVCIVVERLLSRCAFSYQQFAYVFATKMQLIRTHKIKKKSPHSPGVPPQIIPLAPPQRMCSHRKDYRKKAPVCGTCVYIHA